MLLVTVLLPIIKKDIDNNSVHPSGKHRLTTECLDVVPAADEGLLGDVRCVIRVARQTHRKLKHHAFITANKDIVRMDIPFTGPLDKRALIRRRATTHCYWQALVVPAGLRMQ